MQPEEQKIVSDRPEFQGTWTIFDGCLWSLKIKRMEIDGKEKGGQEGGEACKASEISLSGSEENDKARPQRG